MRADINYFSDGLKIAAHLYRPADWKPGDPPRPGIVCVTGYSGRKNLATIDMPIHLCKAGFFTLAPDYRGYGVSEGAPRTSPSSGAGPGHLRRNHLSPNRGRRRPRSNRPVWHELSAARTPSGWRRSMSG